MGTKAVNSIQDLHMMQAAPLNIKVRMTQTRLREWVNYYGEDGVYISFSGGKDSTVLLHIARQLYPGIKAMFVDTGLEYPEIREFVRTFDNVDIVRPKMNFRQVIEKYGYPFISKEVAECVYGARKYLARIIEENAGWRMEQLDRWASRTNEGGGYENKYRKLRGLGLYSASATVNKDAGKDNRQPASATADGDKQSQGQSDDGDYP